MPGARSYILLSSSGMLRGRRSYTEVSLDRKSTYCSKVSPIRSYRRRRHTISTHASTIRSCNGPALGRGASSGPDREDCVVSAPACCRTVSVHCLAVFRRETGSRDVSPPAGGSVILGGHEAPGGSGTASARRAVQEQRSRLDRPVRSSEPIAGYAAHFTSVPGARSEVADNRRRP